MPDKPVTTPEQFAQTMAAITEEVGDDECCAHIRMDYMLCRVLTELGYGDGVAVFERQEKWYE